MEMLLFLIAFPCVAAFLVFVIRNNAARNAITIVSACAIAVASVACAIMFSDKGSLSFLASSPIADNVCTCISFVCVIAVIAYSVKHKNILAGLLALVQGILVGVVEFGFAHEMEVPYGLYIDSLSIVMCLVIGVIGSGICVYAIGYMQDFQDHEPEGEKDRRPDFFALMFLFLSAMFVIVFSDNMAWMFAGWEVTTLCSFLLIGYTRTDEAIRNSFRQIVMNLAGGVGFILALLVSCINLGTLSFMEFIEIAVTDPSIAVLCVTLLAFAGITKAAQMPFQSWLLGAMVAPTPTSALLHSSTMVKAGVFLLVKLAPCFYVSAVPSIMVILIGGITFLLCSFMAISQTNAKRVLAYSTIANLGLITACAGVGSAEAVWAAIFLIIFHAIAKSLLFLCVGTAEHHIGSRDIESMDLLFERMPRLARFMMLGIMGMFIAPFGMLVGKWATLVSFAQMDQVTLILILAFGSAATFMFWAKWLGKLAGIAGSPENVEKTVHPTEWVSLLLMAVLLVVACALLPLLSSWLVIPYVEGVYGAAGADIASDNLWLGSICVIVVVIALFAGIGHSKARKVDVYLSGVGRDFEARTFQNSMSQETQATVRNYYLDNIFGEARIAPVGTICNSLVIGACVILALLGLTLV